MFNKKSIIVIIISLFLLPLRVVAYDTITLTPDIDKHYITNYYYFVEPYGTSYQGETTSYGIFAPQELGTDIGTFDVITLKRNCSGVSNCKTFSDFWMEYGSIISTENQNNRIASVGGANCDIAFMTSNPSESTTVNRYTHGCWRRGNSTEILGASPLTPFDSAVLISGLDCSAVSRDASVTIEEEAKSKIYDYLELKVVRAPLTYDTSKDKGDFNPNVNTASCNLNEGEFKKYSKCGVGGTKGFCNNYILRSPVLGKYEYTIERSKCPNSEATVNSACNTSAPISQRCAKRTIDAGNAVTDIDITQTGILSNSLTPTKIYQGGGINVGFIYYNAVKWDFAEGSPLYRKDVDADGAKEMITSVVENTLIKSVDDFAADLKNNMELSFTGVSSDYLDDIKDELKVNCERTGEVAAGETLTTICTIFMPQTELNIGSGTINNVVGSEFDGITNKVYTDITYFGNSHMSASFSNLNMLKTDDDKEWIINFGKNNEESCNIEVEKRFYEDTSSTNPVRRFIYRPISISNPFPDRNAGVNWYDWWSDEYNKERLRDSYDEDDSLQYRIYLDPRSVNDIKNSTLIKDYYEWDEKDKNNENEFIDNHFDTLRENIKEGGDY